MELPYHSVLTIGTFKTSCKGNVSLSMYEIVIMYLFCHFQQTQLELVQKEEKEMLETRSMPLRNYLMRHVMPTLSQGLIEACKVKPDDPIDYLVSEFFMLAM